MIRSNSVRFDEVEADELGALDPNRIARVVERAAVDRVEVVRPVGVGVVAVHHHHELLRGSARLLRIDDQSAVEPLVNVLLERRRVTVVELHPVRLRLELVGELAAGRHDLEDAVHGRRMDPVEVDRVRVRSSVDELDAKDVALGGAEHRARERCRCTSRRGRTPRARSRSRDRSRSACTPGRARCVRERLGWVEQARRGREGRRQPARPPPIIAAWPIAACAAAGVAVRRGRALRPPPAAEPSRA